MDNPPLNPLTNVNIDSLSFLSGNWQNNFNNTFIEEQWTQPFSKTFLGMFRWIKANKVSVYEILQITPIENTVEMHIRHFNDKFESWEKDNKPMAFVLVELSETSISFRNKDKIDSGWLNYTLIDPHHLQFTDYENNGDIGFRLDFFKQK